MTEESRGGFIILSRRLLDDDIMDKPASWLKLWIYILLNVNWKTTKRLKRGQGFFHYDPNAKHLNEITRNVWQKAHNWMEVSGKIERKKAQRGVYITVLNYDRYQDINTYQGTTEAQQRHNRGTTQYKKEGKKLNTYSSSDECKQKSVSEDKPSGKGKVSWLTPYYDLWLEIMGGPMVVKKAIRPLSKLHKIHGEEKVLSHMRKYLSTLLKNGKAGFISVSDFASKFNDHKPDGNISNLAF